MHVALIVCVYTDKHVDCVYDVTVAYPDSVPENGSDIVFGRLPSVVHFHVKRHALPAHDQLGTWLTDRWTEKEAALTRFYSQPAPPSLTPYTGIHTAPVSGTDIHINTFVPSTGIHSFTLNLRFSPPPLTCTIAPRHRFTPSYIHLSLTRVMASVEIHLFPDNVCVCMYVFRSIIQVLPSGTVCVVGQSGAGCAEPAGHIVGSAVVCCSVGVRAPAGQ